MQKGKTPRERTPREEITLLDFQVIAAGRNTWELDKFQDKIVEAITAILPEAPNTNKIIFRSCQSFLTDTPVFREKRIWQITTSTPLRRNAVL